jgi:hypothetical protein
MDQRFYASTYGRFNTPDPYSARVGPRDPGSWNRYSYTRGDPVNRFDRHGLKMMSLTIRHRIPLCLAARHALHLLPPSPRP